jgi:hypothetical protein
MKKNKKKIFNLINKMKIIKLFLILFLINFTLNYEQLIKGPKNKKDFKIWFNNITDYREKTLKDIKYVGGVHEIKSLLWTSYNFIQPQMMVHDTFFYDYKNNEYTVEKFLNGTIKRYGGIDSVLFW